MVGFLGGLLTSILPDTSAGEDALGAQRARMVAEIAAMARATAYETQRSAFSEPVMRAMEKVPRHAFVPPDQVPYAYDNRALPIGHGQTISQPYVVALMTELLAPTPADVVLEIGTGSGYQAAILAELAAKVYTIEIIGAVGQRAAEQLTQLGYRNVVTRIGDGYNGWAEAAPFDGIIVTAAAPHVPQRLVEQLKPGGRLVIPVESPWMGQDLLVIDKAPDGSTISKRVLPVAFVPLTRQREEGKR